MHLLVSVPRRQCVSRGGWESVEAQPEPSSAVTSTLTSTAGPQHLCPCPELSLYSHCSWRGTGTEPEQGPQLPPRKAEAAPRPSPQALRMRNSPGKVPPAPSRASPGHSEGGGVRTRTRACRPNKRCSALDTQVQGRTGLSVWHPLELCKRRGAPWRLSSRVRRCSRTGTCVREARFLPVSGQPGALGAAVLMSPLEGSVCPVPIPWTGELSLGPHWDPLLSVVEPPGRTREPGVGTRGHARGDMGRPCGVRNGRQSRGCRH